MKDLLKTVRGLTLATMAMSAFFVTSVFASVATVNVQSVNGNDYVLNIYGDPNQAALLYYHNNSNPYQYTTLGIGNTNSSGNLQYNLNVANANVVPNDNIYVSVNGQTSSIIRLTGTTTNTNNIDLSQSSYPLNVGESVTIYNSSNDQLTVQSSSNPSVATFIANGSALTITGVSVGSATAVVCIANTNNCLTMYANISNVNSTTTNGNYGYNYNNYYNGSRVTSPTNGPYTLNICGTGTRNSRTCQNITLSSYADFMFLSNLKDIQIQKTKNHYKKMIDKKFFRKMRR